MSAPGAAPDVRSRAAGDPDRHGRADPAGRRRRRPGRADDAARCDGRPCGPRGRDATGPAAGRALVHAAVAAGSPSGAPAATWPGRRRSCRAGRRVTAAGRGPRGRRGRRAPVASGAGRVVGVLATGDEIRPRGPGARAGRDPRRERAGPAWRSSTTAGGEARWTSGSPRTAGGRRGAVCARPDRRRDAIIVSGGVSVGPYDVVRAAFEEIGRIDALAGRRPAGQAVRVRDGASGPTAAGRSSSACRAIPSRAFVTFELFVRPAIRAAGRAPAERLVRPTDRAVLVEPVVEEPRPAGVLRVVAERDVDRAAGPRRRGPGPRPARRRGGGAGEPRPLGARRGGRAGGHPGGDR